MSKVLYVAEVGSLHKGNLALACEFIRQYAAAGADIVKFQLGWSSVVEKDCGIAPNPIRYIDEWSTDLDIMCKHYGVEFMASIWSKEGLERARSVGMLRYKVPHQKLHDRELVDEILQDGKETFISEPVGHGFQSLPFRYRRIFVQEAYPVLPLPSCHHSFRQWLPKDFYEYYGFSDHGFGIGTALLAVARGAKYIEKHVCLDKTDLSTRDSVFSLLPDEFRQMVVAGREIERARRLNG